MKTCRNLYRTGLTAIILTATFVGCGVESTVMNEPVDLFMVYPGIPQDETHLIEEAVTNYLAGSLNIRLNLTHIPWSSWRQQTRIMLSAGERIDLMFSNANLFPGLVEEKRLTPLDDLLELYGSHITDSLMEIQRRGMLVDGITWGVPTNKDIATAGSGAVRKDLVDKYNLDFSEVREYRDLEPMLQIIKENEPDITPVWIGKRNTLPPGLDYIPISKGRYSSINGISFLVIDNDQRKIVYDFEESPEAIERIRILNDWYEKGYINQDAFSTTIGSADAVKNGKAWMTNGVTKPGSALNLSRNLGFEMIIPESFRETVYITEQHVRGSITVIPTTSTIPDRAMQFLNQCYHDETLINLIMYGIENRHYIKVDENVIRLPDGVDRRADLNYQFVNWTFGNQFITYIWEDDPRDLWEQFDLINRTSEIDRAFGFSIDLSNIKEEVDAVNNIYETFKGFIYSGAMPFETLKEQVDQQLDKAGFQTVRTEVQAQYDAWLASQ